MLTSGMSLQVAAYSYTQLYYNFDSIKLQQINISAFILCLSPLHYIGFFNNQNLDLLKKHYSIMSSFTPL